jgi:hypothetical protein
MSAGVYRLSATDVAGRRIEATGTDVDRLIVDACRAVARWASQ